jgi:hypothetical protein
MSDQLRDSLVELLIPLGRAIERDHSLQPHRVDRSSSLALFVKSTALRLLLPTLEYLG